MTDLSTPNFPADLPASGHEPVLLREVLDFLALRPGGIAVDCTTGRGGHSAHIAAALGPAGTLLCLDADPRNLEFARERLRNLPCNIRFFHANFSELNDVLSAAEVPAVDAILADLGVSTNQIFDPAYGLSFAASTPLDMRLDPRNTLTAFRIVNAYPPEKLANLLFELADEKFSRRIARKIADTRRNAPIATTDQLAELVRSAIPTRPGDTLHPATRTFQALRMAVNREVENLQALLEKAPARLRPAGRLVVISFHSGEDRLVKQSLRTAEQTGQLEILTKKPVSPSPEETFRNPRSRSAKLRAAVRPAPSAL